MSLGWQCDPSAVDINSVVISPKDSTINDTYFKYLDSNSHHKTMENLSNSMEDYERHYIGNLLQESFQDEGDASIASENKSGNESPKKVNHEPRPQNTGNVANFCTDQNGFLEPPGFPSKMKRKPQAPAFHQTEQQPPFAGCRPAHIFLFDRVSESQGFGIEPSLMTANMMTPQLPMQVGKSYSSVASAVAPSGLTIGTQQRNSVDVSDFPMMPPKPVSPSSTHSSNSSGSNGGWHRSKNFVPKHQNYHQNHHQFGNQGQHGNGWAKDHYVKKYPMQPKRSTSHFDLTSAKAENENMPPKPTRIPGLNPIDHQKNGGAKPIYSSSTVVKTLGNKQQTVGEFNFTNPRKKAKSNNTNGHPNGLQNVVKHGSFSNFSTAFSLAQGKPNAQLSARRPSPPALHKKPSNDAILEKADLFDGLKIDQKSRFEVLTKIGGLPADLSSKTILASIEKQSVTSAEDEKFEEEDEKMSDLNKKPAKSKQELEFKPEKKFKTETVPPSKKIQRARSVDTETLSAWAQLVLLTAKLMSIFSMVVTGKVFRAANDPPETGTKNGYAPVATASRKKNNNKFGKRNVVKRPLMLQMIVSSLSTVQTAACVGVLWITNLLFDVCALLWTAAVVASMSLAMNCWNCLVICWTKVEICGRKISDGAMILCLQAYNQLLDIYRDAITALFDNKNAPECIEEGTEIEEHICTTSTSHGGRDPLSTSRENLRFSETECAKG
ncbi:hypothetical protein Ddc_12530 [Ditylenchus destructor]|nr:hypothetical protein Ddc_12530 [Ditylenchus destructor]